jgi:hypothetical protein
MKMLRRWSRILAGATAAVTLAVSPARGQHALLGAPLTGLQEVPPVVTPGHGFALVTLAGNLLTVDITFADLIGTTTASHIHCCQPPGTNAQVATQTPSFVGFPLGVTSGSFLNTRDLNDPSFYNPAFITAHGGTVASAKADFIAGLLGGQSYLNIHSTFRAGGEVRGQLAILPEPSTYALMASGLLVLGGAASRRRRA